MKLARLFMGSLSAVRLAPPSWHGHPKARSTHTSPRVNRENHPARLAGAAHRETPRPAVRPPDRPTR
jgi:hypothetical protein